MARKRDIKPEFWTDGNNLRNSPLTNLIQIALWNFCDDEGKIRFDLTEIGARLGGRWNKSKLQYSIQALVTSGQLRISKDGAWIQVVNWDEDQRVDKPQIPKVRASDIEW